MNNNPMFGQNQFNSNWNQQSNNTFQNGAMPRVNPLESIASQYPQTQQSMPKSNQIPVTPGRMVTCEEEIKASEIPMDGTISLFLQSDYQKVIAKAWNSNGGIDTVRYVLERVPNQTPENDFQTQMLNRLDKIETALSTLSSKSNYRPKQNKYNNQGGSKPNDTGGDQK